MPITSSMLLFFPWLENKDKISEGNFTWEEKEFDNSFLVPDLKGKTKLPENWIVLGWCEGGELKILPKQNTIAVLFEEDCRRFWVHISIIE